MATSPPNRRIGSGCFVVLIICLALAVFVTMAVLLNDPIVALVASILGGVIGGAFLNTPPAQEFLSRLWGHLEDFGVHLLDWVKKNRLRVGLVVLVVISLVVGAVGEKLIVNRPI